MKYIFQLDTLFATLFIFFVIVGIGSIPISFDAVDPVAEALKDFESTDIVFNQLHDPAEIAVDENIVLINIGEVNRATIAKQIDILNKYQPKVMAMDIRFIKDKTPDQDFPLMMAFSQVKNLVLGARMYDLDSVKDITWHSLETSNPKFTQYGVNAYVNVHTGDANGGGFRTTRRFIPRAKMNDSTMLSFPAKIAQLYDSTKFEKLMQRTNVEEIINWRGNIYPDDLMKSKFMVLDVEDVLNENFDGSIIKDKILLFGFMGRHLRDEFHIDDKFYTPLNEQLAGRAYPDMYGVVVHANVISMILHEDYINYLPNFLNALIAFILCYLNVALFLYIADKAKIYYDLITKMWQLVESIALMTIVVILMSNYNLKIEFTFALIAILLSGDLTELYAGSIRDIFLKLLKKVGLT